MTEEEKKALPLDTDAENAGEKMELKPVSDVEFNRDYRSDENADANRLEDEIRNEAAAGTVRRTPTGKNIVGVIKPKDMVRMVLSLTVICVCAALLLSAVNALTRDKIAENLNEAEKAAIAKVCGSSDIVFEKTDEYPETVNAVYTVYKGEALFGWCISVSPSGFGGNIDMVVGVAPDGSLIGVTITALSETPGLGSRVADDGYLAGYNGKRGTLVLNKDVDAISGATISSRSVLAGVNSAVSALVQMGLIGGEG